MNAKRMLNISGILNTLAFPPLYIYLQYVFVSVHRLYHTAQRASEPQREAACTHTCLENTQRK